MTVTDNGVTGAAGCGEHCGAKSATGVIEIEITDVNEPPSLSTTAANVDENLDIGTLVKTLTANDPEDDAITFLVHRTRTLSAGGECDPGGSFTTKVCLLNISVYIQPIFSLYSVYGQCTSFALTLTFCTP